MTERKLPNNCLLKKTKDLIELRLFQETLKKFDISGKCVLVLDTRGSILINNFLTLSEVINNGIFSVDSIYKERKQYKNFSAIYLISGDTKVLDLVKKDFKEKHLYEFCHLFIIDEITDKLFDYMTNKEFLKYIKTLKQVSVNYVTIDKNLFSFGDDINFNSIYNLFNDNNKINNLNISRLYNVCQALNIYPNIIYYNPDKKCKFLAENVNKELKKYFGKKKKEGILLITSRFMDFLAPLKFSIIYQNILLEFFKDKETKYCNKINIDEKNGKNQKISYILDYKDELYNKYKYRYIYDVTKLINDDIKEFKNSEAGKAIENIDNEIVSAAKNFGKYKSYSNLLGEHLNLCSKINNYEKKRCIIDLMNAQKTIISKINEKGKKISESDIISIIKDNKDKFKENKDFLRIICLVKYNYPKINLENIYKYVNLSPEEKELINNINKEKFPVDIGKLEDLDNSILSYREKTNYKTDEENENNDDKRYNYVKESKLTTICDMLCKNKLPNNLFTFVEKPENIQYQQKTYVTNFGGLINDQEKEEIKQNLILFNIGGLSNYEVASLERGVYLGQYNMNLILGGNKVYNHEEYFKELVNYYIKKKNTMVKTLEGIKIKKVEENILEKVDTKIDIDISYDSKGSKEKMKKKKNNNLDDTYPDDFK